jgi:hypothetical protein
MSHMFIVQTYYITQATIFFSITSIKEFTSRMTGLLQDKLQLYCNLYTQTGKSLIVTIIEPAIME